MAGSGAPPARETIPAALAGVRLDRVVSMLTACSRAEAAAVVKAGEVLVNERVVTKVSHSLVEGDVVEVLADPIRPPEEVRADESVEFTVLYEDEGVIVVNKPAGLVVHPGSGHREGTLVGGLLARYPELAAIGEPERPGIVHRLDRGTSGLLVIARTEEARLALIEDLSEHRVDRIYTALVWGHLEHQHGTVDAPIARSRRDPLKMAVSEEGRYARTHYEVDRRFLEPVKLTLVTCSLETGRTHQIRVHLRAIGHPVVGDELYNGARPNLPLPRPFLHARRLAFEHPLTGEPMSFDAPLPEDLAAFLERLA